MVAGNMLQSVIRNKFDAILYIKLQKFDNYVPQNLKG